MIWVQGFRGGNQPRGKGILVSSGYELIDSILSRQGKRKIERANDIVSSENYVMRQKEEHEVEIHIYITNKLPIACMVHCAFRWLCRRKGFQKHSKCERDVIILPCSPIKVMIP